MHDRANRRNNQALSELVSWKSGNADTIEGSSITPFSHIAKAYSHKPKHLELSVLEDTEKNVIHVEVTHDGNVPGFLYQVMVSDQEELRKPDENLGPLGEEMITTQDISLRLIEETEVRRSYAFDLKEN